MSWCILWYLRCCTFSFFFPDPLDSAEGSGVWNKEWQKNMSTENCPLFSDALSEFLHAWDRSSFTSLSCFSHCFPIASNWLGHFSEFYTHLHDRFMRSSEVLIFCFILCFSCLCSFCFQLCAHQNALQCSTSYSTAVTWLDSKRLIRLWLVGYVSWYL